MSTTSGSATSGSGPPGRESPAPAIESFRGVSAERADGKGLVWRLRQPVVPFAKRALRAVGSVTASSRVTPDFLVIGAKRGGSTSLYRNLVATPGVLPLWPEVEDLKGTYFFDLFWARGESWYRGHFPTERARRRAAEERDGPVVVGEASPYYLHHPHAPARARAVAPNARIIAVLRDPVARAHSHYKERRKQQIEALDTFAEAVAAESGRLDGEFERMVADPDYVSWNHLNFGYVAQGRYLDAVRRWEEQFGQERVLVLRSEDLYADAAAVLNQVRSFLGLEPVRDLDAAHYNNTGNDPLPADLEANLRSALKDDVEALESHLGRDLHWL